MLSERWPVPLLGRHEWRPFPTIEDRGSWDALAAATREAFLAAGEAAAGAPWPRLRATQALDFVRTGDRDSYERPHFARRGILRDLTMAECIEGAGRFLDPIADALWSICEETWWGWPAALGFQRRGPGLPDVTEQYFDLGVGESAALVAWVDYLLAHRLDPVSPLLRHRIEFEARRRVIDPFLERDDYWWAKVPGNWNTWCHANALVTTLLLEDDDERRNAVVDKVLTGLDVFVDGYPPDGGCTEGPTYWTRAGGALFECLELLGSATEGGFTAWDEKLIAEIGRFIVRAHVADDWYVNFADGAARLLMPGHGIFRFGRAIGDGGMVGLGADAVRRAFEREPRMSDGFTGNPTRTLSALFWTQGWEATNERAPMLRDVWLPHIQVMAARDSGGTKYGLFVAAKGGHNDEHHNHNDVGSFVVYVDGEPALIDVGVGAYTAKTFGGQRYDIWTMRSGWHNTPVINGVEQEAGRRFAATGVEYHADGDSAVVQMDIAAAYPETAGVECWKRTVALARGHRVQITDDYSLVPREAASFAIHLVTAAGVAADGPGRLRLDVADRGAVITFDPAAFEVEIEAQETDAENLIAVWGGSVSRIRLVARDAPLSGRVIVSVAPA